MPSIATTDAQGLFTKYLVATYRDMIMPKAFLRSFFTDRVTPTLELSIEVQRGTEKVAVDVVRGSDGNRNDFARSTEKIFIPPYYREWFDMTQLQLYDRLYGATSIDDAVFAALINSTAEKLAALQAKIERAYEKLCSEVLELGTASLINGTTIDFKRKAASLVNNPAQYFTTNTDFSAPFQAGAEFLRTKGKSQGGVFNAIFGQAAWDAMLLNTTFTERQNLFNMALDGVRPPQANALGQVLMGYITAGSWRINCWTYPEYYDNASGDSVEYLNSKKVIMIPEAPKFVLGFGAVPQLLTPGQMPKTGAFVFGQYKDERGKSMIMDIESAGLPIPVAVDQIYTFQAIA